MSMLSLILKILCLIGAAIPSNSNVVIPGYHYSENSNRLVGIIFGWPEIKCKKKQWSKFTVFLMDIPVHKFIACYSISYLLIQIIVFYTSIKKI